MEVTGTVKLIGELETYASGFQKRQLVVVTDEQYPQPISIEFVQDKTDLLNSLKKEDTVKVGINLRGREWVSPQGETKYFNSIVGWRVENTSGEVSPAAEAQNPLLDDEDPFGF